MRPYLYSISEEGAGRKPKGLSGAHPRPNGKHAGALGPLSGPSGRWSLSSISFWEWVGGGGLALGDDAGSALAIEASTFSPFFYLIRYLLPNLLGAGSIMTIPKLS